MSYNMYENYRSVKKITLSKQLENQQITHVGKQLSKTVNIQNDFKKPTNTKQTIFCESSFRITII